MKSRTLNEQLNLIAKYAQELNKCVAQPIKLELPIDSGTINIDISDKALAPYGVRFLDRIDVQKRDDTANTGPAIVIGVAPYSNKKRLWFLFEDSNRIKYDTNVHDKNSFLFHNNLIPADSQTNAQENELLNKVIKKYENEKIKFVEDKLRNDGFHPTVQPGVWQYNRSTSKECTYSFNPNDIENFNITEFNEQFPTILQNAKVKDEINNAIRNKCEIKLIKAGYGRSTYYSSEGQSIWFYKDESKRDHAFNLKRLNLEDASYNFDEDFQCHLKAAQQREYNLLERESRITKLKKEGYRSNVSGYWHYQGIIDPRCEFYFGEEISNQKFDETFPESLERTKAHCEIENIDRQLKEPELQWIKIRKLTNDFEKILLLLQKSPIDWDKKLNQYNMDISGEIINYLGDYEDKLKRKNALLVKLNKNIYKKIIPEQLQQLKTECQTSLNTYKTKVDELNKNQQQMGTELAKLPYVKSPKTLEEVSANLKHTQLQLDALSNDKELIRILFGQIKINAGHFDRIPNHFGSFPVMPTLDLLKSSLLVHLEKIEAQFLKQKQALESQKKKLLESIENKKKRQAETEKKQKEKEDKERGKIEDKITSIKKELTKFGAAFSEQMTASISSMKKQDDQTYHEAIFKIGKSMCENGLALFVESKKLEKVSKANEVDSKTEKNELVEKLNKIEMEYLKQIRTENDKLDKCKKEIQDLLKKRTSSQEEILLQRRKLKALLGVKLSHNSELNNWHIFYMQQRLNQLPLLKEFCSEETLTKFKNDLINAKQQISNQLEQDIKDIEKQGKEIQIQKEQETERRKQEEEARLKLEEEARQKREEERKREEEERKRLDEERKRLEAEQKRQEEERKRLEAEQKQFKEEEQKKLDDERKQREAEQKRLKEEEARQKREEEARLKRERDERNKAEKLAKFEREQKEKKERNRQEDIKNISSELTILDTAIKDLANQFRREMKNDEQKHRKINSICITIGEKFYSLLLKTKQLEGLQQEKEILKQILPLRQDLNTEETAYNRIVKLCSEGIESKKNLLINLENATVTPEGVFAQRREKNDLLKAILNFQEQLNNAHISFLINLINKMPALNDYISVEELNEFKEQFEIQMNFVKEWLKKNDEEILQDETRLKEGKEERQRREEGERRELAREKYMYEESKLKEEIRKRHEREEETRKQREREEETRKQREREEEARKQREREEEARASSVKREEEAHRQRECEEERQRKEEERKQPEEKQEPVAQAHKNEIKKANVEQDKQPVKENSKQKKIRHKKAKETDKLLAPEENQDKIPTNRLEQSLEELRNNIDELFVNLMAENKEYTRIGSYLKCMKKQYTKNKPLFSVDERSENILKDFYNVLDGFYKTRNNYTFDKIHNLNQDFLNKWSNNIGNHLPNTIQTDNFIQKAIYDFKSLPGIGWLAKNFTQFGVIEAKFSEFKEEAISIYNNRKDSSRDLNTYRSTHNFVKEESSKQSQQPKSVTKKQKTEKVIVQPINSSPQQALSATEKAERQQAEGEKQKADFKKKNAVISNMIENRIKGIKVPSQTNSPINTHPAKQALSKKKSSQ